MEGRVREEEKEGEGEGEIGGKDRGKDGVRERCKSEFQFSFPT